MLSAGQWPILDHDDNPSDVVSQFLDDPARRVRLPERAVLAFLGPRVARHAADEGLPGIDEFQMVTASYPIHRIDRDGRSAALVEVPIGAAAAVMVAEYLIKRGVRTIVAVGSCGALVGFGEGEFLVPVRALRDEGTSYHYLPPAEWVATDPQVTAACLAAARGRGHAAVTVDTWTTDGFFRETPGMIARRVEQGCQVVEMECAAIAACAEFRGVRFGQLLFTADSLASETYDRRDFGVDSHEVALRMAVDAVFGVS